MKKIRLICAILAAIFLFGTLTFVGAAGTQEEAVSYIEPSGKAIFFPAGADLTHLKVNIDADSYSIGDGEDVPFSSGDFIDVTPGKSLDTYKNDCYKVKFKKGAKTTEYTFMTLSAIPTVFIETSAGINYINSNKEYRDKNATILICDESGDVVYSDEKEEKTSEIKGRGNATWGYAKKPYQIKLGKKTDLFGMGKAKSWILLANYIDESNLRNAVSYEVAEAMGLPFTPKSVFVNLYIDDEFYGLYQLIEKTQIGDNRVEIFDLEEETDKLNAGVDYDELDIMTTHAYGNPNLRFATYVDGIKDPEDITGGYLVELDNLYYYREKCYFQTTHGNTYVVKSPENASRAQMEYISNLISEAEDAIYSPSGYNFKGKHYSEYFDVESLVQLYMAFEMTKNWDSYVGSTFFYKDKDDGDSVSKIYSGPVWDFDNTYGNQAQGDFHTDKTGLWAGDQKRGDKYHFGMHLIAHTELWDKISYYCRIAAERTYEMLAEGGFIDKTVDKIYNSVAADKQRWKSVRPGTYSYLGDTTDTVLGFLTDFMKERADGLYRYFVGGEPPKVSDFTTTSTTEVTEPQIEPTEPTGTAMPTEPSTPSSEPAPTETTAPAKTGGCGAGISAVTVLPAAAIIFAVRKKKSEDDNG